MLLGRFRILTKALVPLVLLIAALAGVSFLAVDRMRSISEIYRGINDRELKAARMMADARLLLARFGAVGYRLVAETSMQAIDDLDKERQQLAKDIPAQAGAIKAMIPEHGARLDEAVTQFKKGADATEQAMLKTFGSQQDQALKITAEQAEPALGAVKKSFAAIQQDIDAKVAAAASGVEETVEASVRTTIAAALAGGIIAVLLAVLILRAGIAMPLLRLARTMQTLAEGDYSMAVAGLARRDEVGQMARTVEVFKQNGIAMRDMRASQDELERRAAAEKRSAMDELAANFESTVKAVVASVAETAALLQERSGEMGGISADTSQRVIQM